MSKALSTIVVVIARISTNECFRFVYIKNAGNVIKYCVNTVFFRSLRQTGIVRILRGNAAV